MAYSPRIKPRPEPNPSEETITTSLLFVLLVVNLVFLSNYAMRGVPLLLLLLALVFSDGVAWNGHGGLTKKVHHNHGKFTCGPWKKAHATFYGGRDGSGTREGACGYKDTVAEGYGVMTVAVSTAMFTNGERCGACYEVKCVDSPQGCKPGCPPVVVTATNLCPDGGWCSPPKEHFDLTMPAFLQIAEEKAGIVPVEYRRVPCKRDGGIRYTITGNKYFNLIMVGNVGGAGDVVCMLVKGNKRVKWTPLKRNWGQMWQTSVDLTGESLTFRVVTGDHRKATSWHALPHDWQFGVTYQAKKNFK